MADWKPPLTNSTLLSEVIRKIDDDAPRLAYADWLETEGAPECADFIRVECALAKASPADDDYPDLIERKREVIGRMWNKGTHKLDEYERTESYSFRGSWHEDGDDMGRLRRGFQYFAGEPSHLELHNEAAAAVRFRDSLDGLVQTTTVRGLLLHAGFSRHLDTILATPAAGKLTALQVYFAVYNPPLRSVDTVDAILSSPIATSLEWLDLMDLTGPQMARLGTTEKLTQMRRLKLRFPADEPEAIERMMTSAWFQGLQDVRIGLGKASSPIGLTALAKLKNLQTADLWDTPILEESSRLRFDNLSRLNFRGALLTSTGMKTLMSWSLPNLKVFKPECCSLKSTAIRNLTKAEWARQLRVLSLESNSINDKCVSILADSGILRGLRILNLSWNAISAGGLMPLAAEGVMPQLATLELHAPDDENLTGTEEEMERFLHTLILPKLRHLDLSSWPLGDRGAMALAANPSLSNLRSLRLWFCKIGQKGAAAICESPHLSNLLELDLAFNDIGEGLGALRDRAVLPQLSRLGANTMSDTPATLRTAFEQTRNLLNIARPEIAGLE